MRFTKGRRWLWMGGILALTLGAEPKTPESTPSSGKGVSPDPTTTEEIELEAIEIKGKVDKPGVIILPKRIDPDVETIEIQRSFGEEVKNGIDGIPVPDRVLDRIEPVENIEKLVEKER